MAQCTTFMARVSLTHLSAGRFKKAHSRQRGRCFSIDEEGWHQRRRCSDLQTDFARACAVQRHKLQGPCLSGAARVAVGGHHRRPSHQSWRHKPAADDAKAWRNAQRPGGARHFRCASRVARLEHRSSSAL